MTVLRGSYVELRLSRNRPITQINQLSLKGSDIGDLKAALFPCLPGNGMAQEGGVSLFYDLHAVVAGSVGIIAGTYEGDLTIRQKGQIKASLLLLPLQGHCVVTLNGRKFCVEGARGVFVSNLSNSMARFVGSGKHFGLRIAHQELVNCFSLRFDIPIKGSPDFTPEIDLSAGSGPCLMRLAAMIQLGLADGTLNQAPIALSNLTETAVELLIDVLRYRHFGKPNQLVASPLPRNVKRAIDYMHAHISEPITISGIASACGVSLRTLQQGFRDFRQTTPFAFLQHLRLEAVHHELMEGGSKVSIKQVALKWGFVHLGRFSADYRKCFGVLPSETLRTSSGDPPAR